MSLEDSDSIVSRLKAAVVVSEQADTVEVLHRSYELCEGPNLPNRESSSMKMPDTPPDSPVKTVSILQNTSPASTISTLSPVPSNLSDQDKDEDIKTSLSIFPEAITTDFRRSKAPPPSRKILQACPTPHPKFHHQKNEAQRLAASPRRSRRALRGPLRASPAHQSGRRTAWRTLHCWSCTQDRFCARAALGNLPDRRSRRELSGVL